MNEIKKAIEKAAQAAWFSLMDSCKQQKVNPSERNDWFALVGQIRALTTNTDSAQEREAFEAWAKNNGLDLMLNRTRDEYFYSTTISAWAAWQARASLAAKVEQEPVAWMYQHDETGRVGFVDAWQVQNGWEKGNPRLHLIKPLYTAPQAQQESGNDAQEAACIALQEIIDAPVSEGNDEAAQMKLIAIRAMQASPAQAEAQQSKGSVDDARILKKYDLDAGDMVQRWLSEGDTSAAAPQQQSDEKEGAE